MVRTLVVTDSNVGLPGPVRADLGLRVVPISILLTDRELTDEGIDARLVFDALGRDEEVKSSPPSVLDYVNAIDDGDHDAVVVLTPAAEFTSMFLHASRAAELAAKPVRVLDTRTAAAAQTLVVLETARAARTGAPLDEVEAVARDAIERAELVAALDRVATIEHSGRIPSRVIETVQGSAEHPVFRFRDGAVTSIPGPPEDPAGDPLEHLVAAWRADGGADAGGGLVFHAAAEERAHRLRRMLTGSEEIIVFSPAIALYTGPGVVGVAWLRAPGT
jgi:DegV family protein with EDD domain